MNCIYDYISFPFSLFSKPQQEQNYDEVVKELIIDEKQYLRDLFMITKVFRDLLHKHNIATPRELEVGSIGLEL